MSTTTHLNELRINYLTQAQYDDALENDEINENELYFTPDSGGIGTSVPTANTTAMFDSNAYMNSDDMNSTEMTNFLNSLNIHGLNLIDLFYPVGSYYETSDTTFNPNTSWSGTWVLELEGQVHVSAGTNYPISGASTNTSDGGNTDAIIPYHNHGFTNPQYQATEGAVTDKASFNTNSSGSVSITSSGGHTHTVTTKYTPSSLTASGNAARVNASGTKTETGLASIASGTGTHTHTVPNHTHSLPAHGHSFTQPTISLKSGGGGSVAYAGTSGNTANANMQPYIVVNRWHRIA